MVVEIDRVIFGGGSRVSPFLLPFFFLFFFWRGRVFRERESKRDIKVKE